MFAEDWLRFWIALLWWYPVRSGFLAPAHVVGAGEIRTRTPTVSPGIGCPFEDRVAPWRASVGAPGGDRANARGFGAPGGLQGEPLGILPIEDGGVPWRARFGTPRGVTALAWGVGTGWVLPLEDGGAHGVGAP